MTTRSRVDRPDEAVAAEITPDQSQRCNCEVCKVRRFESEPLGNAVIHSYTYKPRNWDLKAVEGDPDRYYLGVELETDNFARSPRRGRRGEPQNPRYARITNEQAAGLRAPKSFWIPKYDGSISGPEFVSMPATMAWWKENEETIAGMLKALLHGGFRSHDNDQCGMHINISRNAFDDTAHLYRFLSLIHSRPKWTVKMAQRTEISASHWASLEYGRTARRRKEMARAAGDRYYSQGCSRYSALNVPYGEARFEFRLPRGTLRIDRFMKNLEWTHAMIEYTRVPERKRPTGGWPVEFMRWAIETGRYPHLAAFVMEKFHGAIAQPEPITVESIEEQVEQTTGLVEQPTPANPQDLEVDLTAVLTAALESTEAPENTEVL